MRSDGWTIPLVLLTVGSVVGNALLLREVLAEEAPPRGQVEFQLVYFYGPSGSRPFPYRVREAPDDETFLRQAKFVLDEYGLGGVLRDGALFVDRELAEDKSLMAIVTARSQNLEWLASHGYEGDFSWTLPRREGKGDIEKRVHEYWKAVAEGRGGP